MDAFLASLATIRTRKAYATVWNALADWVQVWERGGYTEKELGTGFGDVESL